MNVSGAVGCREKIESNAGKMFNAVATTKQIKLILIPLIIFGDKKRFLNLHFFSPCGKMYLHVEIRPRHGNHFTQKQVLTLVFVFQCTVPE